MPNVIGSHEAVVDDSLLRAYSVEKLYPKCWPEISKALQRPQFALAGGTTAFLRSPRSTAHNNPHRSFMAGFKPQNDLPAKFPTRSN
jgi:hypothetical protein